MSFTILLSLVGSLFLCSFSSVLSAFGLVFFTFFVLVVLFWNLASSIPLYLFSIFMIGGLFVLIGFVMMADDRDLDMVLMGEVKEWFMVMVFLFVVIWGGENFFNGMELNSLEFNFMKMGSADVGGIFFGTFLFLIFLLLIFLFIVFSLMKGSLSSGGFVKSFYG